MKRLLLISYLVTFVAVLQASSSYTISTVLNPKLGCANCYVVDPLMELSEETVARINAALSEVEDLTSAQVSIVILPSIVGDEQEFAQDLGELWGVGRKDVNNGVVWLYVINRRAMHIATGYGVEGSLPDVYLSNLLQEVVFPHMRNNDPNTAFLYGVSALKNRLTDESVREEMLLNTSGTQVSIVNIVIAYFVLSLLVFLVFMWRFYYKTQSLRGDNNIKWAMLEVDLQIARALAYIFFFPNAFLYLYIRKYRRMLRHNPIFCHSCSSTMHLLTEEEEDQYLDKSQQNEEKFLSVDYDVWLCRDCLFTHIVPYVNIQTKMKTCPVCAARTYRMVSKRVLVEASAYNDGRGQEEYQCLNCSYTHKKPFSIPKVAVAPAVFVAGGMGSSRGGGFGSGFGGGFGGGSFGGGGAGGSF